MLRKFHLTDFPEDCVYILLEDNFREKFFDKVKSVTGSYATLAKVLKVSKTMITKWRKAENKSNGKLHVQCTPLWAILKMVSIIQRKYDFSVLELEKHVKKYQARGGWSILEPNLPLIENECLIRLFFHFAGDGYAGQYGGSAPNYYNTNPDVINEFVNDLSVFGIVKVKFGEGGKRALFPKVITHVIKHLYKTNFKSDEVRIPLDFLGLDNYLILQGIKALADDEGTVGWSRIRISMINKRFLSEVLNLLKYKTPQLAKYCNLKKKSRNEYCLTIFSKGMKLYKRLIGFTHSQKKQDLDFCLKIKNKSKKIDGRTKTEILKTLIEERTVKELMYIVKASPGTIRKHILGYYVHGYHIFGLEELGLVEKVNKESKLWKITSKGKLFLSNKV